MSTPIIINGTTFNFPTQSQNPAWGEELTDTIVAIADVINSITGPSDILLTSFTLANNQAAAANVNGASFDPALVRSAIISYSIYRSTSLSEFSECGQIYLTYKTTAATWEIAQNYSGNSGVTFSITNAGQLQYVSSNLSGTSYLGKLKFKATAFLQA